MLDRATRRDLLKASGAVVFITSNRIRSQETEKNTTLSFEDGEIGSASPPDPWYLRNHPQGSNKICEMSSDYASDGDQSMHIGSYGDLREVQVAVDVDLSNVETVLYDGYLVASNPNWGDVKVNVGDDTISGRLVNGDPTEKQWYNDVEADASNFSGEHTLYFWVRGDPNDAYFDNFRFLDGSGNSLSISDVVPGVGDSNRGVSDSNGGTGVQAEIDSFSVGGDSFSPGDTIEATATVVNTGGSEHTFFVGYSATPDGSNESYDNNGSTGQTVTLSPNESTSVNLSVTVPSDAPLANFTVISSLWRERDRDNLETRLDTATQSVVVVEGGESTEDYVSGTLVSVNGSPAWNFQVMVYTSSVGVPQGSADQAASQLIAEATTNENGRFEFDGETRGGSVLTEEMVNQIKNEGDDVTLVAQDAVNTGEPAMEDFSDWISVSKYSSEDLSLELGEVVLNQERIFAPSGEANNLSTDPAVWRTVNPDNTSEQIFCIEVTSGVVCGNTQAMEEGGLALQVPEDLYVGYDNMSTEIITVNVTGDTLLPECDGNTSGFPAYLFAEDQYTKEQLDLSPGQEQILEALIGEAVGPASGAVGVMEGIWEEVPNEPEQLGSGADNIDKNEEDLVSGGWDPRFGQDVSSFVLKVPVQFEDRNDKEMAARGSWKTGFPGQPVVFEHEFKKGPNIDSL